MKGLFLLISVLCVGSSAMAIDVDLSRPFNISCKLSTRTDTGRTSVEIDPGRESLNYTSTYWGHSNQTETQYYGSTYGAINPDFSVVQAGTELIIEVSWTWILRPRTVDPVYLPQKITLKFNEYETLKNFGEVEITKNGSKVPSLGSCEIYN